ncbi:MAG: hypothetical protein GW893_02110 [Armatimonadetes bacterium]|nr:hypothetical protein [Armatimonadota bacterium]
MSARFRYAANPFPVRLRWVSIFLIGFSSSGNADEVNLSLYTHRAIPTASDSLSGNYQTMAGAFADGKTDTAWVTGKDMQDHWGRISWRNISVEVQRVEINFTPMALVYNPPTKFGETVSPPAANVTTVIPVALEMQAYSGGQWRNLHRFPDPIKWKSANVAEVVPSQPLKEVTELRLRITGKNPDELFGVRELSIYGPKPESSFSMRPKWQGVWTWGELEPNIANYGIVRRYLRHVFSVDDPAAIESARVLFVAHDRGKAYLNGTAIAATSHPGAGRRRELARRDIDVSLFRKGKNLFALAGEDVDEVGSRGILAELWIRKKGGAMEVHYTHPNTCTANSFDEPGWNTSIDACANWPKATANSSPNHEVEWFWSQDYVPGYLSGSAQCAQLTLIPEIPRPGEAFRISARLKVAQPLQENYGLIVRYGDVGLANLSHLDLSLGEGFVRPDQGLPKGFQGERELTLTGVWPSGTPPRLPLTLIVCNAERQLEFFPGPVGEVTTGEYPGRLRVEVGAPAIKYGTTGFPLVKTAPGGRLSVDGKIIAPIAYTSSLQTSDRYQEYLKSGTRIFRLVAGGSSSVVPNDADAEVMHTYLLNSISTQVAAIHAMAPDARFLLYLNLDTPNDWNLEHPEALITLGNDRRLIPLSATNASVGYMHETPNAPPVVAKVTRSLREFIGRLGQEPYAHSVLGCVFGQGRAGENYWGIDVNMSQDDDGKWVIPDRHHYVFGDYGIAARQSLRDWLREKYGNKETLAKAWKLAKIDFEDVVSAFHWPTRRFVENLMWRKRPDNRFVFRDRTAEGSLFYDFVRHQNDARTELLLEAAKAVKDASGGRLLVGSYGGYVIPNLTNSPPASGQHSGHGALAQFPESPYLDFLCSPHFYRLRRAGDPVMPMCTVDSLRLHGKIWMNEYDSRSFLSPISPKTFSQKETLHVFRKEFGNAITRDHGWWWYEFPSALVGEKAPAWFADPDMLRDASLMKRIYDRYLSLPLPGPSAEIALIVNVEQIYYTDVYSPANTIHSNLCNFLIPRLSMLGAPFDVYAQTDLRELAEKGWLKNYKLVLFLNSFHLSSDERKLIDKHLKREGKTLLFFYAPGYQGNELPDTELSIDGIQQVTGMKGLQKIDKLHLAGMSLDSQHPLTKDIAEKSFDAVAWWGYEQIDNYGNAIAPIFYLDPAQSNGWESLARFRLDKQEHSDKCALAMQKSADHTVVYSLVPDLPTPFLSNLAAASGVHIYSRPGVLTWANPRFLCVHTGRDARKLTLHAREKVTWLEPFERKVYAKDTESITIDLPEGETRFFCLHREGEWNTFAE